ncbi:MAG TPA: DUF1330 domain-containing protein [Gammaproteobacteria bacterium]|jgi:uncharacterized protein (DUF1330 family)|nr:DUF1330 domain-containing protein [Candidatus Neomarinimicrobiota bacterium]HJL81069.1 DUF1330 domain-containing protein [Gammaproteobacteria bacterium]HJP42374.1 DUF1330 domain-containing protein [Gammaproteobacteria bacterium]|tara:strand:- start:122 stop:406 length:285 start_codon:yes stop_codon:yes gene_type:complete
MKGYWIVRCQYNDQDAFEEYASLATKIVADNGGKFLIRGGQQLQMENGSYERTVMVEFPNLELAKEIYHSQEYQEAYNIIASSAERDFVIVEGL